MSLKNVGGIDRIMRIVAGIALLALTVTGPHTPWGLVGLIPRVTGLAGWCPAYTVPGIRSCPRTDTGQRPTHA